MKNKKKETKKNEYKFVIHEPKNFKKGECVNIVGGIHQGKEGEIYDMEIKTVKTEKNKSERVVFFGIIIEGCFLELINQDFLDPKGKKGKK